MKVGDKCYVHIGTLYGFGIKYYIRATVKKIQKTQIHFYNKDGATGTAKHCFVLPISTNGMDEYVKLASEIKRLMYKIRKDKEALSNLYVESKNMDEIEKYATSLADDAKELNQNLRIIKSTSTI